ncbi:MAG: hypothetical protein WBP81_11160 [Solirubrobacteraceae bacterium]
MSDTRHCIAVWAGTLAGVLSKLCWINAPKWLRAAAYIALGSVAVASLAVLCSSVVCAPG